MATITRRIGLADHGKRLTLDEFLEAEFDGRWLYELAKGVIEVTNVPGVGHALLVRQFAKLFLYYEQSHPGVIYLSGGGGECRMLMRGIQSDRHPDQSVYLVPPPSGPHPWERWVPEIVVEVLSEGSETRDLIEKREEYLLAGVTEYWVLDPFHRMLLILQRAGNVWRELLIPADGSYRTDLLPGLEVHVEELLSPLDSE